MTFYSEIIPVRLGLLFLAVQLLHLVLGSTFHGTAVAHSQNDSLCISQQKHIQLQSRYIARHSIEPCSHAIITFG